MIEIELHFKKPIPIKVPKNTFETLLMYDWYSTYISGNISFQTQNGSSVFKIENSVLEEVTYLKIIQSNSLLYSDNKYLVWDPIFEEIHKTSSNKYWKISLIHLRSISYLKVDYRIKTYISLFSNGSFQGCSPVEGGQKDHLPKFFHTNPTMMKLDTVILYLQNIWKTYKSHDTLLISAEIDNFDRKSATFVIWRNADIDFVLMHNF